MEKSNKKSQWFSPWFCALNWPWPGTLQEPGPLVGGTQDGAANGSAALRRRCVTWNGSHGYLRIRWDGPTGMVCISLMLVIFSKQTEVILDSSWTVENVRTHLLSILIYILGSIYDWFMLEPIGFHQWKTIPMLHPLRRRRTVGTTVRIFFRRRADLVKMASECQAGSVADSNT